MFGVINQVPANVILDNFGHHSRHGAPRTGDQVHDLFDLAADAPHPGRQRPPRPRLDDL
jgi:hypothetical protein